MSFYQKAIEDFCRLCAVESQQGITIYSSEGESLGLEEKILNCLHIQVSRDDLLPKKVCHTCNTLLEDYHQFFLRALQVQQTLGLLINLQYNQVLEQEQDQGNMQLVLLEPNVKLEEDDCEIVHPRLKPNVQLKSKADMSDDNDDLQVLRTNVEQPYRNKKLCNKNNLEIIRTKCNAEAAPIQSATETNGSQSKMFQNRIKINDNSRAPLDDNQLRISNEIQILQSNNVEILFKPKPSDATSLNKTIEVMRKNDNISPNQEFEDTADLQIEKEWRKYWGITCNQCEKLFFEQSKFDEHYQSAHDEAPVYTCSYCKQVISSYPSYRSHCYGHIYDGRFKCKLCDKKFCMKSILGIHMLSKHASLRRFICEDCGAEFVSHSGFKNHQLKHTDKKEFKCIDCPKVFKSKSGLSTHKTHHLLGQRFMCDLCGRQFSQKINMQKHVKQHNGDRPFACDICGKGFVVKSHMIRHRVYHTIERPYECKICNKKYKTEHCLKVHSNVHSSVRPHKCSYCGKGFLSSSKLKQHYNVHTGERPYSCNYCEKTFTNYPNWLKHTRLRHKVDPRTGHRLQELDGLPRQEVSVIKTQALVETPVTSNMCEIQVELPDGNIEFIEMPEVKPAPTEVNILQDQQPQFPSLLSPFSNCQFFQMTDSQLDPSLSDFDHIPHNSLMIPND